MCCEHTATHSWTHARTCEAVMVSYGCGDTALCSDDSSRSLGRPVKDFGGGGLAV